MKRYFFFWFALLATAFANATVRELVYKDMTGEHAAHNISVFTGIVFMGFVMWLAVKRWGFSSQRQAVFVGIMWVVLTEMFETIMIIANPQKTFADVLHAHNIMAGELWSLAVVWIGIAPYLFYRLQKNN